MLRRPPNALRWRIRSTTELSVTSEPPGSHGPLQMAKPRSSGEVEWSRQLESRPQATHGDPLIRAPLVRPLRWMAEMI